MNAPAGPPPRRGENPLVGWMVVAIRDTRPSGQDTVCDVCGRTLLRGEQADAYVDGSTRRQVCELCKDRALHEGWVREGTVTAYEDGGGEPERRRSWFGRLRGRRDGAPNSAPQAPTLRDELDGHAWSANGSTPVASREPRHVRAVPASVEQKVANAAELFNASEHPRTVAGVARSLGAPGVSLHPSGTSPSLVTITVWWELCWYRYEVDLSDSVPSVRQVAQGYELSELSADEQQANAVTDERGALHLPA